MNRSIQIIAAAALSLPLMPTASAAPGADVYGAKPIISGPQLSPDGQFVATMVQRGEDTAVRIAKLGTNQACDYLPPQVKVRDVFWANAGRVAVEVSFFYAPENTSEGRRYTTEVYRYLTLDTNCAAGVELLRDHPNYERIAGFGFMGRMGSGDELVFRSVTGGQTGGTIDLYRVNSTTGKSQILEKGNSSTVMWRIDAAGKPRIRGDYDYYAKSVTYFARLADDGQWTEFLRQPDSIDESKQLYFISMSTKPGIAYVNTRNGGDRDAIYEYDLAAKSLGKLAFSHPSVDADGVMRDSYTRAVLGFLYTTDTPKVEFVDRAAAQRQADVEATFPGEFVSIQSASQDGNRYIAYVEGKENPGGYYHVIDIRAGDISLVGKKYETLTSADLAPVRRQDYKARDGLNIPAYLTLPPGGADKNLPLIVMPHGGPGARDDMTFDAWSQFLATRGYAVLRPNFRGSTGYGAAFYEAGRKQWGRKMQDDLTDGVKALVAAGTIDASRVCIFGWSYGGYAAMAGLALTPEIYKCGASGAGISDLLALTGQMRRSSGASYAGDDGWADLIGDPSADRDRLILASPFHQSGRIQAPLLMFHGTQDTVVLPIQSEKMLRALDSKNKWAKLISFDGEDHWISKSATGKRMLAELEAFLAENLKK